MSLTVAAVVGYCNMVVVMEEVEIYKCMVEEARGTVEVEICKRMVDVVTKMAMEVIYDGKVVEVICDGEVEEVMVI